MRAPCKFGWYLGKELGFGINTQLYLLISMHLTAIPQFRGPGHSHMISAFALPLQFSNIEMHISDSYNISMCLCI